MCDHFGGVNIQLFTKSVLESIIVYGEVQLQLGRIQSILVMVRVLGKNMNRASNGVYNRLVNNWLIPSPVPIPTFVVEKQFIITLIIGHVDNHTFRSPYP